MLKDTTIGVTSATSALSMSERLNVKALLKTWLNHPNIVIGFTTLVTFWGVWQLGYYYDDWSVLAALHYKYHSLFDLFQVSGSTRFPIWGIAIAVFLIQIPLWLSHTIVIVAHAANAMLMRRVLEKAGFGQLPALAAALLFLVWPVHGEILFWLAAGAAIWGLLFVLIGLNLVMDERFVLGTVFVFMGFLNTEGVILPGTFALLGALWYKRAGWRRIAFSLVLLTGLYGLLQFARSLIDGPNQLLHYKVGLANLWDNISFLGMLQIGQTTSQDANWLWRGLLVNQYTYTIFLADYNVVLLAGLGSAIIGWWVFRRTALAEPAGWRFNLSWLGFVIIGWCTAIVLFTIITQQQMQARYTYTMTVFFCTALVLVVYQGGRLIGKWRGEPANAANTGRAFLRCALIGFLTWSIFLTWSDIYRNWLPSKTVSERIINDLKLTGTETKVSQIYIADNVKAIGNAYAIGAPWAYQGVGQLFLGKDVLVTLVGDVTSQYPDATIKSHKFTDKSCVFVSWKDNKRITSPQMIAPYAKIMLDCKTGMIGPLVEPAPGGAIVFLNLFGIDALKELDIKP